MVETEHVRLRTNVSRDRAAPIAVEMQRIRDVLAASTFPCAFQGSPDPLMVTVLRSSQYSDIAPENAAGYYQHESLGWLPDYKSQIVLPDDLGQDSIQVFQHEMIHHLVASCLPEAPRWLHEGLASFLETAQVDSGRVTLGRPTYVVVDDPELEPQSGYYKDVRVMLMPFHMLPSIQSLIAKRNDDWTSHDKLESHATYATAWALVHFFELGAPDLYPRFHAYLQGLRRFDGDPQALFTRTFDGIPLQERLNAYLRRGSFPDITLQPSMRAMYKGAPRIRPMNDGEGHLHMAWLWSRDHSEDGRSRMRQHLAAAKAYQGTRTSAHLLEANVLFSAKDWVGVEHELVEGLRGAADDAFLLQAHVDLLLDRGDSAADVLASAERLRPVARTADQFCTLARVELGKGDTKAALALVVRGMTMNPSSWYCRFVMERMRSASQVDRAPNRVRS